MGIKFSYYSIGDIKNNLMFLLKTIYLNVNKSML